MPLTGSPVAWTLSLVECAATLKPPMPEYFFSKLTNHVKKTKRTLPIVEYNFFRPLSSCDNI